MSKTSAGERTEIDVGGLFKACLTDRCGAKVELKPRDTLIHRGNHARGTCMNCGAEYRWSAGALEVVTPAARPPVEPNPFG